MAITFVSTGVEGAFATEEHPYAAHGPWLQVRSVLFPFFPPALYLLPTLPPRAAPYGTHPGLGVGNLSSVCGYGEWVLLLSSQLQGTS